MKVCIISREFPPDSAFGGIAPVVEMEARSLARAGADVHVITLAAAGRARREVVDGYVVHRLEEERVGLPGMEYVAAGVWSATVGEKYARLDALVGFDVLRVQDYYAEALHVPRRPETLVVAQLHASTGVLDEQTGRRATPGSRGLAGLERAALAGADLVVAPSELVRACTAAQMGELMPPTELLPRQFDPEGLFEPVPAEDGRPRMVYVGRLEPMKGADTAMHALAAVRRAGIDATLTLVGRDVVADGRSHRRDVLVPLMRELGLDFGDVRFVEQLDRAGVARHLRGAALAVLPSRFESFHAAAVEALACAVPVVSGERTGLREWVPDEAGLRVGPADDPERFGMVVAAAMTDRAWRSQAGTRGARRVRDAFDPAMVAARELELFAAHPKLQREPEPRVERSWPRFAVVVLAHNQLEYTKRCVASLLAHTSNPLRIYLVDNASTDGTAEWAAGVDPRVTHVRLEENRGVSGGRNAGLAAIEDEPDYVVFLDNDVEVFAGWWKPAVAALMDDPEAGIAGEQGIRLTFREEGRDETALVGPGPVEVDMVVGFAMFMRAPAVRQIGRFDENLGLFWHDDDDYCMRAGRLGHRVLHIGSGRILHYEHKSSSEVDGIWQERDAAIPSAMSTRNQAYLARRQDWLRGFEPSPVDGSRTVAVAAYADELVAAPGLLRAYTDRFSAEDDVSLVVHAPGREAAGVAAELSACLEAAVGDRADAPDMMLLALPADCEATIAGGVDAVLSERSPAGAFHAAPHLGAGEVDVLADLVDRRVARVRTGSGVLVA